MMKKLFAFALAISISFWAVAPSASAATADELQAMINDLLEQIATLQAQLAGMGGGGGTVTGCTITSFDRNLSVGMTGEDVKCLQIVLNSDADTMLASSGAGSPGNETTYFGPITKAGAIKFQEKYADEVLASWGLTSGTGYIGSTSRAKLNSLLAAGGGVVDDDDDGGVVVGGFNVYLAADTPEAGTIVADSTSGNGAQALIPVLKVKFSNGNSSDVDITSLKFKRSGISADTDILQGYIYDENDNLITEYSSFSDGVMTFSGNLLTVGAGKSETVTLKFDLTDETSAGKTLKFSLLSASDITSDAASVGGNFPIEGNTFTTAQASDLGQLTLATTTQPSTTPDPQDDFEVFNFSLLASDQKIEIRKIKFTNAGSVAWDDIKNFKLYDGGTQLGSTIEWSETDKTVTFDLRSDPLIIGKGVTKQMHLRADLTGGTNRTFQFSIQEEQDIEAYDTEYNVFIRPDGNQTSWQIHSFAASTIQTGKLSLSRASDSPTGSVPKDGTNVSIAKWDIKATGEDVKVSSLVLDLYGGISTGDLYQTKIYFDGSQKGTTINASSAAAVGGNGRNTITFGSTFVIPADGEYHNLEVKADIKKGGGASYSGSETLTAKITSVTATGRDSLASVSSVSSVANQLTIAAGTLSVAQDTAVAWSSTVPTGVVGQTNVLVGSFVVTAGVSEGADITAVKIIDGGSTVEGFTDLQNLRVFKGTKETGTQIDDTQSSLATNTTYTFYPSPYISLDAGQSFNLRLYADIKTATTVGKGGYLVVDEVDGTGKITNTAVDVAGNVNGQILDIAAAGSLSATSGDSMPISANLIGGNGQQYTFTQVKFTAGAAEDIEVTDVIFTASRIPGGAPTSTVYNLSIWDGSTQIGQTQSSLNASTGNAYFKDISWTVPAGDTKDLVLKGYVNAPDTGGTLASSGAQIAFHATPSDSGDSNKCTEQGICWKGVTSGVAGTSTHVADGNFMYTYRTGVSVAANANTPSGSNWPVQYDDVLYFDITNTGNYTAYLNGVTTTISWSAGTGNATPSQVRTFNLYDSVDMGTSLGSGTINTSTCSTTNGSTITISLSTAKAIPAGGTKTFKLIGDTRDASAGSGGNPGTVAQFYIADGTDLNWDDGISTAVQTTRTFASPVQGGALTF